MSNELKHVAIIMDGNGRWAKGRGLERFLGHRKGTQATIDAVKFGCDLHLEHLTLYVFSSENWQRPSKEVDYLMKLLVELSPGEYEEAAAQVEQRFSRAERRKKEAKAHEKNKRTGKRRTNI